MSCMELIFQYGFRSSRLFRNRFFIWDFLGCYSILLVCLEFLFMLMKESSVKLYAELLKKPYFLNVC